MLRTCVLQTTDYKGSFCIPGKGSYALLNVYMYARFVGYPQAVPDTRLTIKKYSDAKYEYLVSLYIYIVVIVSLV